MGSREEDEIVICKVPSMIEEMLTIGQTLPPLPVDLPEIVQKRTTG